MITEKLAHFVAETGVDGIPQDALNIARMGITDCIGVTFPGSLEPLGKIMRTTPGRWEGLMTVV